MKQLLAHLIGDYIVQTDWAANEKTSHALPAAVHASSYAACFLPLTRDPRKLAIIGGTHYLIDRYRLAKYVTWATNQAAPADYRYAWSEADGTGFKADTRPDWLTVWLMFITDNTMHLLINNLTLGDDR